MWVSPCGVSVNVLLVNHQSNLRTQKEFYNSYRLSSASHLCCDGSCRCRINRSQSFYNYQHITFQAFMGYICIASSTLRIATLIIPGSSIFGISTKFNSQEEFVRIIPIGTLSSIDPKHGSTFLYSCASPPKGEMGILCFNTLDYRSIQSTSPRGNEEKTP